MSLIDSMRRRRTAPNGKPPILLFFKDHEVDSFVPYDRYLKRFIKLAAIRAGYRPRVSGFQMWFRLLGDALRASGYEVEINNRRLARAHPDWPVGLVGYPTLVENWDLPNPAILGPALYNLPTEAPTLMDDPRHRFYIVTCDWLEDIFRPQYGNSVARWFAGIDTANWSVSAAHERDIDMLIYDKIRFDRDAVAPDYLAAATRIATDRGLRTETVTYGQYSHDDYRDLLARSRSMLFLCESETQGMAYQEALASDVPVLAWDQGIWMDPDARLVSDDPVPATSVPYFSPECGERFRDLNDIDEVFERFWARLDDYRPRDYVERELSLAGSAESYMTLHRQITGAPPHG